MYTTIDELIISKNDSITIDNSVERDLLHHMEEYVANVENNETNAYNYATQIVLNC